MKSSLSPTDAYCLRLETPFRPDGRWTGKDVVEMGGTKSKQYLTGSSVDDGEEEKSNLGLKEIESGIRKSGQIQRRKCPMRQRRRSTLDAKTDERGNGGPAVGFRGRRRTELMGGLAATRETEPVKRATGTECRRTIERKR